MTVTAAKRRSAIPTPLPSLVPPVDETSSLRRTNAKPEPRSAASAETLTPGQEPRDTQSIRAGDHLASGQVDCDVHHRHAAGNQLTPGHDPADTPTFGAGGHLDGELLFYAALLDDIEDLRKRTANRALALAKEGVIAAEHERQVKAFADLEDQAVLHLQRAMRKHPYAPWVKQTLGVGEKQGARLLAAIGDPYWNAAEGRPRRGPAELWAYCGYAPGQKLQKGVKANWNAEAKMRAFLVAEKCMNTGVRKLDGYDDTDGYDFENRVALTPHAQVYLDARRSWADRDTSEGHKHNHALRRVAKEVLKDLWRFGRDLSEREAA